MTDEAVEHAISLIKAGQIEEGGEILAGLLHANQQIERAWAWMYACVQTDEQRIYCLRKVLEINPNHERAKLALEKLTKSASHKKTPIKKIKEHKPPKSPKPETGKTKRKSTSQIPNSPSPKKKITRPPEEKKVITTKPDENLYADELHPPSSYPEPDAGMFGTRLFIGGILITPYDCPICVDVGHVLDDRYCYNCEFFSEADCPLIHEPSLLSETWTIFAQRKHVWVEYEERRRTRLEAIYSELKEHGRPLHYETLFRIIKDRHPNLHLRARQIAQFMGFHPEMFEWVDSGVYKAR